MKQQSKYRFINTVKGCTNVKLLSVVLAKRILNAKSTATLFHIGAYTGEVALEMEELMLPNKSFTYAIEPCPRNFKLLEKIQSKRKNFVAINCGVSDVAAKKAFYIKGRTSSYSSQSNSIYESFVEGGKKTKVEFKTICDLIHEYGVKRITIMRINCEGGEFEIFNENADLSFLKRVEILSLAIHGKDQTFLTDEMIHKKIFISETLSEHGFEQVYGFKFTKSIIDVPVGHIWQIWIKKKKEKL